MKIIPLIILTTLLAGCAAEKPTMPQTNYFNTPVYYPSYSYTPYYNFNYTPILYNNNFGYGYDQHWPR